MSFNVINLKHREAQDMWLHIKDADGELMYADDKKKKPVRVKFKSIHGEVFRKAFLKMNVRLSRLKSGKQAEYEKLSQDKHEITPEEIEADVMKVFMDAEYLAIDFITEMAIDWEGFIDEHDKPLEFEPEYLHFVVSKIENYHVLNQIREAFKNSETFILA
ncbi:hypothetical protein VPHK71_0042 [Vibrio phage K71]|nr:hypothetical protein SIPHO078v2_p0038 [Vibrio phage 14E30.1]